jgi:transposase
MIDRQLVDLYMREVSSLDELVEGPNRQLASIAVNDRRVKLLLGFTGIDYYRVLLILYEIGDIRRFPNPKKLASWIGLAPSPSSQEM